MWMDWIVSRESTTKLVEENVRISMPWRWFKMVMHYCEQPFFFYVLLAFPSVHEACMVTFAHRSPSLYFSARAESAYSLQQTPVCSHLFWLCKCKIPSMVPTWKRGPNFSTKSSWLLPVNGCHFPSLPFTYPSQTDWAFNAIVKLGHTQPDENLQIRASHRWAHTHTHTCTTATLGKYTHMQQPVWY